MTNANRGIDKVLFKFWKGTVCPRILDPFYIVTYFIKWTKTFWTYSMPFWAVNRSNHSEPTNYIHRIQCSNCNVTFVSIKNYQIIISFFNRF